MGSLLLNNDNSKIPKIIKHTSTNMSLITLNIPPLYLYMERLTKQPKIVRTIPSLLQWIRF